MGIPASRPSQRHLYRVSSVIPQVGSSLHSAMCLSCSSASSLDSRYAFMEYPTARTTGSERTEYDGHIDRLAGEERVPEGPTLTSKLDALKRTTDKYKPSSQY